MRTSESGHIEHQSRADRLGVVEGIGEYKSTLGVRIIDLYCLAVSGRHHVTWLDGPAPWHVLTQRDERCKFILIIYGRLRSKLLQVILIVLDHSFQMESISFL